MRKRFEQQLKLGIIPISGVILPIKNGMDLWHILVLSVVRLGLDADYDRLEDFANHHKLIRQIMEVETVFGEAKVFS
ncbi:MAG: hypothetical protein B6D35_10115 [Candidatus Brocadia sp. UTAMX2]|nr:MAG: hypothetical protein B6D35_10115 [Candidatus Brocadia sp. UTAMX2]